MSHLPKADSPPLVRLADASLRFAKAYDDWLKVYGARRKLGSEHRRGLQQVVADLDRLSSASRAAPSVGIYGESQCGKSNLVSRIGSGLGALSTTGDSGGSLLVKDPGVPESEAPWRKADGGAASGGIEFATWLNPTNNNESTGVICRFTGRDPGALRPGCYVARLLTHADLVSSIAMGYQSMVESPRLDDMKSWVDQAGRETPEADEDNLCGHLLMSWRVLEAGWGGEGHPNELLRALCDAGWPDLVQNLYDRGKRPRWIANDEGGPFVRMVQALWGGDRHLSRLYALLLGALRRLEHSYEVSIPAEQVCRTADGDRHRSSLLDVNHLDQVFNDSQGAPGIRVDFRSGIGDARTDRLPLATVASLVRELVLPLAQADPSRPIATDVLDFPGARAVAKRYVMESDADPRKAALDMFRRGKLNRLFSAGVQLQDCTALCLAVTGNGNLEAGPVVTEALKEWLKREDWPPTETPRPGAPRAEPPLVVAVTKSDMLLSSENPRVFGDRLREIHRQYGGSLGWMQKWVGGPFRRIHWVHNPRAGSGKEIPKAVLDRVKKGYLNDESVCAHLPDRHDELFESIREKTDVRKLFETIDVVVRGVPRSSRLCDLIAAHALRVATEATQFYLGKDDGERVERERREAAADVDFLREGCSHGWNSVASFLRCLRIVPSDVHRACREAFRQAGGVDPREVGIAKFDQVYHQLHLAYCTRLERGISEIAGDSTPRGERLTSLLAHFRQLPGEAWFRERVRSPEVQRRFGSRDPAALMHDPVLATFVTTAWNRSTVWLDEEPALCDMPAVPPRRRPRFESSTRILAHWQARLPEVYRAMVDPKRASGVDNGNPQLGTIRAEFRDALASISAHDLRAIMSGADAEQVKSKIEKIEWVLKA